MEQLSKSSAITSVNSMTESSTPQCDNPQENDSEDKNSGSLIISALEKHFRKYYNKEP